jgi:glycerol-1-phosphate dehydrogenase [NAD(P)+]
MVLYPTFGNWISIDLLNRLDSFALITMEEPWEILSPKVEKKPNILTFNQNMDIEHLENLANTFSENFTIKNVVGLGGGTACDTAKFLAWQLGQLSKEQINLYLIPSIISVDAFLCSAIAVREEGKVKYIGEIHPEEIIVDYELIKKAPPYLNRAGVSDTISITTALGDWKIAYEKINEKFDQSIFNRAKRIVIDLMKCREDIRDVSESGIRALVDGFYKEVVLCEEWGNPRPEEGSEHFFAYCLESITHQHYIHGNLIGMAILISIYLQGDYAEFEIDELVQFFSDILINISPRFQGITEENIESTLKTIKSYVLDEMLFYSVYNLDELTLNNDKIKDIINMLKKIKKKD